MSIDYLNGMGGTFENFVPKTRRSRKDFRLPVPNSKEEYSDRTGAQRLVIMFAFLLDGGVIHPSEYAHRFGISRYAIHGQMNKLIQLGVPLVRTKYGTWQLLIYTKEESREDENIRALYEGDRIGY